MDYDKPKPNPIYTLHGVTLFRNDTPMLVLMPAVAMSSAEQAPTREKHELANHIVKLLNQAAGT